MHSIPPCVHLYQPDRRSWLEGIIAGLEEELRVMPRHRWNTSKIADREKAIAAYRESLSRLDAAAAESRRPR
jgi:hypothetical protein